MDKKFDVELSSKNAPELTREQPGGGQPGGELSEKTGLSGGQIAGIVLGSVLLAGIGGFAIFWFAVKKKKFADLIAVFKKK